jgi:ABC-type multidrug transport system ATPase subunit
MTNDNQEDQLIAESHKLSFEHLTFSVPCKKRGGGVPLLCSRGGYTEVNTIVDNISGHVSSGQMVSIMGPSGAGKVRQK